MSAPDTNLKKQEKHHRAPLIGIRAVVAFALVLLALLAVLVFARGDDPSEEQAGGSEAAAEAPTVQTE